MFTFKKILILTIMFLKKKNPWNFLQHVNCLMKVFLVVIYKYDL
jgi:hypothetical protein